MRSFLTRLTGLAFVAATAVSCGDVVPTSVPDPQPGEPTALLGTVLDEPRNAYVLQREVGLPSPVTASRTIGFFGGTISLPQAGLTVYVPVGAVLRTTTISVTAPAGHAVAYEFRPHGTRFLVPLVATQELGGTKHEGIPPSSLFAGYVEDLSELDAGTLVAPVTEVLNVALLGADRVRFPIGHFSGYIIASGFADDERRAGH